MFCVSKVRVSLALLHPNCYQMFCIANVKEKPAVCSQCCQMFFMLTVSVKICLSSLARHVVSLSDVTQSLHSIRQQYHISSALSSDAYPEVVLFLHQPLPQTAMLSSPVITHAVSGEHRRCPTWHSLVLLVLRQRLRWLKQTSWRKWTSWDSATSKTLADLGKSH